MSTNLFRTQVKVRLVHTVKVYGRGCRVSAFDAPLHRDQKDIGHALRLLNALNMCHTGRWLGLLRTAGCTHVYILRNGAAYHLIRV